MSPDPLFIEKVRDIVGLYLNPPDAAIVLCVDEKSQIQALDRTSPVLPLIPGTPERRTHDYGRHGTTNLYAALDVASGNVIADLTARHRAEEFRRFLNLINRNVPDDLDVHVDRRQLLDAQDPGDPAVARCATPASRCTSRRPTARGSTSSNGGSPSSPTNGCAAGRTAPPKSSKQRSELGLTPGTKNPRPFVWHKTADEILDNLANYCERISDSGH